MSTPEPAVFDNGWVIFWGIIFAVFIPIVGFILGLTQINRGGGLGVVLLSIVCGIGWFYLLMNLLTM